MLVRFARKPLLVGDIVALDATRAAIRLYTGGTHRTPIASGANTVLAHAGDTISRIYEQQRPRPRGSLSRCKPATPLSWNSGVLTMLGRARQVRSDHPWAPGSALMATPRRNCSLGEERDCFISPILRAREPNYTFTADATRKTLSLGENGGTGVCDYVTRTLTAVSSRRRSRGFRAIIVFQEVYFEIVIPFIAISTWSIRIEVKT